MPEKVTVLVNKTGEIETVFSGFEGDLCFDEADRIKGLLRNLGIKTNCVAVVRNEENKEQAGSLVPDTVRQQKS